MTSHFPSLSRLVVVGANHRSSSLIIREKLVANGETALHVLERLKDMGIGEAVIIATGDRLEVFTLHDSADAVAEIIARAFAGAAGLEVKDLAGQLFVFEGEEVVRHVFAVMATLDGLIPGDPHIRGQVRAGHRLSMKTTMSTPELDALIHAADETGERVLRESDIADHPSSLATAAVHLSKDVHGDLSQCTCVVLGGGDSGELLARHLHRFGLTEFILMGEAATRMEKLAQQLGGRIVPMDDLAEVLAQADILVSSLGTKGRLITTSLAGGALRQRKQRQILLFDTAIPGDIERAVGDLEGTFLYDLNDLENLVMEGRMKSNAAVQAAWEIVNTGLAGYVQGEDGTQNLPVVRALQQRLEALHLEALGEAGVEESNDAKRITERFLEKVMRGVADELRAMVFEAKRHKEPREDLLQAETMLRRLFGLTKGKDE